ncbi:Uma2 family endonuclease [Streptomyces sp. NPDC092296]|uniref:Uma2 family endonuclease n=1 Tax=Streptomyces sp. NPDC092296 TaxID=3366012 RepID=UPI003808030F
MATNGSLAAFFDTYDFPEEVRVEFIDGEIIMQAHPMALHDYVGRVFVRTVPEPFEAWNERGIELGKEDKPKPDVVIIRSGDWSDEMREFPASILLAVVETVSTGRVAIRRDYEDKRLKYQEAGIPVYALVDPNTGEWTVLALGTDGVYAEHSRGVFGEPIRLPAPLDFTIPTTGFHRYPAK